MRVILWFVCSVPNPSYTVQNQNQNQNQYQVGMRPWEKKNKVNLWPIPVDTDEMNVNEILRLLICMSDWPVAMEFLHSHQVGDHDEMTRQRAPCTSKGRYLGIDRSTLYNCQKNTKLVKSMKENRYVIPVKHLKYDNAMTNYMDHPVSHCVNRPSHVSSRVSYEHYSVPTEYNIMTNPHTVL